ncbi:MAG: hypothetical protein J2P48_16175 [Alphaproteobacteria bacterium]|nr:hypothetical protein [Alphaproteobacteria bacterium]
MAENDFVPFATGRGAFVTRPDADEQRFGFNAGPSRVRKANALWRQGSFMAAALAQFVADATGEDVRDNGDIEGFVAQLLRALGARRTILTRDLDLYVSTSGNDDNPGTPEAPFRTLQRAADTALMNYELRLHSVNIHVETGAYDDGATIEGPITPDPWRFNFIGNEADPSRCVIAKSVGTGACFQAGNGACYTVRGFTVQNSTTAEYLGGSGLACWARGSLYAYNIHFGSCTNAQVDVWNASLGVYNDIRIIDRAPYFLAAYAGANVEVQGGSLIFLGSPAIPVFVAASGISRVWIAPTAVGGAPAEGTIPVRVSQNSIVSSSMAIPGTGEIEIESGGLYFGPDTPVADPGVGLISPAIANRGLW